LGVAAALLLAIASNRFSERVHVPAPALFLLAAALASDVFHSLRFDAVVDAAEAFTAWARSRCPAR
ncbi:MAG: hypothetical protein ACXVXG_13040, partial [Nocardioidaceae bacterium]